MRSVTERPPILTVHEDQGDYILRVSDTKYHPLVVAVSKLLPARRLIVVTPGDVKFFVTGGSDAAPSDYDDAGTGPADPLPAEPVDPEVIAEQERHAVPNADSEPALPSGAEVVGETPQGTKVVRRKRNQPAAGHDEVCQRCAGHGVHLVKMPDGSAAESPCPICKGEGKIIRYGARR